MRATEPDWAKKEVASAWSFLIIFSLKVDGEAAGRAKEKAWQKLPKLVIRLTSGGFKKRVD
jgi:hypothetical protein